MIETCEIFLTNILIFSSALALHRNAKSIEASDVRLCLERNYGHVHPGKMESALLKFKQKFTMGSENHRIRMNQARKANAGSKFSSHRHKKPDCV